MNEDNVSPIDSLVERIIDIAWSDPPAGADTSNQQFPENFEKWTAERKDEWFDGVARATYDKSVKAHDL